MTKSCMMTHGRTQQPCISFFLSSIQSFCQGHLINDCQTELHKICFKKFGKNSRSVAYLQTQPQYSSLPWCRRPHSCGMRMVRGGQLQAWSREWLTGTSLPSWCPQSRSCTRRKRRLRTTANMSLGLNLPLPLPSTHHGWLLRAVFGLLSWVSPLQLQSGGELL